MNFIDRLTDKTVLEKWLVCVANVITNNIRTEIRRERADVIGKIDFPAVRSREPEASLGRHLITDLDHAPTFVRSREILKDNDRLFVYRIAWRTRQIEIVHVGRAIAEAV